MQASHPRESLGGDFGLGNYFLVPAKTDTECFFLGYSDVAILLEEH